MSAATFSQNCGTPTDSEPQHFEIFEPFFSGKANPICINVYFHIVRQTNGIGGFDSSDVLGILNLLNNKFNPHDIYIKNTGIGYLDNSIYYDLSTTIQNNEVISPIFENSVDNAINIYLVNSVTVGGASASGVAQKIESKNFIVINSVALTSTTPHELGHCLNLWHTFQGTANNTSGCSENIDGSNCIICGDYVCDTPADANTGNSGGYTPDITNIMSYYTPRTHFTNGQGVRMRNALLGSQILQQVRSNQCSFTKIVGAEVICDTSTYTYYIQNMIPNTNVTWQVPPQFQTVSSTNTNITVEAYNIPANGGTVTLKAILPTHTLEKNIRLGKPEQPQVNGPLVVQPSHVAEYEVVNHIDGSEYEWTFPQGWETPFTTGVVVGPWAWGKPLLAGQNGYITVTVTNDCDTDYLSFYVTAELGGGGVPKSSVQNMFIIYPNPASHKFYIKQEISEQNIVKISHMKLFNKNGYLVKEKYSDNISELDIIGLREDIYFLKIFTENNNIEIHRIIIKN